MSAKNPWDGHTLTTITGTWTLLRRPRHEGAVYIATARFVGPSAPTGQIVTMRLDEKLYTLWLVGGMLGNRLPLADMPGKCPGCLDCRGSFT